jgi:DMSO/TMAO reductase YedYZ molybdopterin-dependent catalytic subunit
MASETKKGKFNRKILALIIIVVVVVAAASVAAVYMLPSKKTSTVSLPAMSLTVVGASGQQKVLSEKDIAALQSITGKGGSVGRGGMVMNVGTYTGVKLSDVCNLVGGISSGDSVTVKCSDGYSVSFTYDQVANGKGFSTYDSSGNSATPTHPIYLILAYQYNGTNLPSGSGPLKAMVIGQDGLLTAGNIAANMVIEIDVSKSS